jgi:phenylalanyl-tRNA synthetase alpha chain
MIDRIEELRSEAQQAIAGARPAARQLEELRVRYLGRKAELPRLLREVADRSSRRSGPQSARRPTRPARRSRR